MNNGNNEEPKHIIPVTPITPIIPIILIVAYRLGCIFVTRAAK